MGTISRRSLSCAAAGITAAVLTGVLAGTVFWVLLLATARGIGPDADLVGGLVWILTMCAAVAAVSGTPSGVLVMCLSRANEAPWRSLPIILAGTTTGLVLLGLPFWLLPGTNVPSVVAPAMSIIGPTAGGIVATRFLPERGATSKLSTVFICGFLAGLVGGVWLLVGAIFPLLSTTVFANLSWNIPSQRLIYVLWLAAYAILGIIALLAAVAAVRARRTIWTGLGVGLASSLFVVGAFYLLAIV